MSTGPGGAVGPRVEVLPELEIEYPPRQRRWTVLIRVVLLIPQLIVLYEVAVP